MPLLLAHPEDRVSRVDASLMHTIIFRCSNSRKKCTKYKTCTELNRFPVLNIYSVVYF